MTNRSTRIVKLIVFSFAIVACVAVLYFYGPVLKKCKVHKIRMRRDIVEIQYGLPNPEYIGARRNFPNSNKASLGGCTVLPESPTHKRVTYCPKCREAENDWRSSYKSRNEEQQNE
jgi:hypothetical protein